MDLFQPLDSLLGRPYAIGFINSPASFFTIFGNPLVPPPTIITGRTETSNNDKNYTRILKWPFLKWIGHVWLCQIFTGINTPSLSTYKVGPIYNGFCDPCQS